MKRLAIYITVFSMVIISYPFVTKAMTVSDVEQQLNLYKSEDPAVLGASSDTVKSTTEVYPKVMLSPENAKILIKGLKYSAGSSMIINKNLKVGQKDSANDTQVKGLQLFLNAYGQSLSTDGVFGSITKAAVMEFQKSKSLVADGVVGPKTRLTISLEVDATTQDTRNNN
jgi:murein L,D-transpeptidase YcbB/YkuD